MQDKHLGTLTNRQVLKNWRINFLHDLRAQDQQYFFPKRRNQDKKKKKKKKEMQQGNSDST